MGIESTIKSSNQLQMVKANYKNKLTISEDVMKKIHYLHHKSKVEWSGPIYYTIKVIEGIITVKVIDFMLMDVGTSGGTEYDYNDDVMEHLIELNIQHPDNEIKIGHLHTHHSMEIYFSGVDISELFDNAPNHEYYLSLIVGYNGKYVAKIAFIGEQESVSKPITNYFSKDDVYKTSNKVMFYIDMNIEKEPVLISFDVNEPNKIDYDSFVSKEFIEKFNSLEKPKFNHNSWNNFSGFNQRGRFFGDNSLNRLNNPFFNKKSNTNSSKEISFDGLVFNKGTNLWVSKDFKFYKYNLIKKVLEEVDSNGKIIENEKQIAKNSQTKLKFFNDEEEDDYFETPYDLDFRDEDDIYLDAQMQIAEKIFTDILSKSFKSKLFSDKIIDKEDYDYQDFIILLDGLVSINKKKGYLNILKKSLSRNDLNEIISNHYKNGLDKESKNELHENLMSILDDAEMENDLDTNTYYIVYEFLAYLFKN